MRLLYRSFYLFFALLFLSFSCTTVQKKEAIDSEKPQATEVPEKVTKEGAEAKTELVTEPISKKMGDYFSEVILFDVAKEREVVLSDIIPEGKVLFAEFSASWCKPCVKLTKRINKMMTTYGNHVFFIMILEEGDSLPDGDEIPDYPIYYLKKAPKELNWNPIKIYPSAFIYTQKGTISAEINGLYPTLYYMSFIDETLSD